MRHDAYRHLNYEADGEQVVERLESARLQQVHGLRVLQEDARGDDEHEQRRQFKHVRIDNAVAEGGYAAVI